MLLSLSTAAEQIRAGQLSPVELLDQCLARIDRYEPHVRAWVVVDRDGAREQAEARTAEMKRGRWRGPLHGIPVGIKDIFDVFDLPTTCGSKLWANSIARRDCTVVERLRQAGAVILGKTVTTAYASFDPPPTRNPWDPTKTPGGSSSGSAAAVACGMCLGAIGSQTGGSITRPASYCGVAGCKPTYGRVSLNGALPLAHSMDHPGPIAHTVGDLSALLDAISDHDWPGPRTSGADPREAAATSSPPRLGRLRGFFEERAEPAVRAMMDDVANRLKASGIPVSDVTLPASFAEVEQRHRTVMAVEAAQYHEPRLRRRPDDYPPRFRELLDEGLACPAPEYARCKEHQKQLRCEIDRRARVHSDAFLTPATTSPAPDAATTGDPAFNSPWSYTGMPTVSIPAAWTADGLPLAIQLVGTAWCEAALFRAAAWCERVLSLEPREPVLG